MSHGDIFSPALESITKKINLICDHEILILGTSCQGRQLSLIALCSQSNFTFFFPRHIDSPHCFARKLFLWVAAAKEIKYITKYIMEQHIYINAETFKPIQHHSPSLLRQRPVKIYCSAQHPKEKCSGRSNGRFHRHYNMHASISDFLVHWQKKKIIKC